MKLVLRTTPCDFTLAVILVLTLGVSPVQAKDSEEEDDRDDFEFAELETGTDDQSRSDCRHARSASAERARGNRGDQKESNCGGRKHIRAGSGSELIGPDGGSVLSEDGMAELTIPPGALTSSVRISVQPVAAPPATNMDFAGPAYDFQPDGLQFSRTARLTIRYEPSRIAAGVKERRMNLYVHEPISGTWTGLYAVADTRANTVSASIEHFTTYVAAPDRDILIYVISDRTDSSAFGVAWYQGPADLDRMVSRLQNRGFPGTDVMDEVDLPELDAATLSHYRQVWLVEGDGDRSIDVTAAERDLLLQFYSLGRGVWISSENDMDRPYISYGMAETNLSWYEDADFLMEGFGVDNPGDMILTGDVTYSYDHPELFRRIDWLSFNGEIGRLTSTNPAIQWVLTIIKASDGPDAPAGMYTGMGVLDERASGAGRAVFDSGWVLGYAFYRLHPGDDNRRFCLRVARFLDN